MFSTIINGFILGFVASPTCPSNGEVIKEGTKYGFIFALIVGLGAITGDAIALIAVLFGLMALIQYYPLIQTALWLIGGAVLLYVSWGIFSEIRTVENVSDNINLSHKAVNTKSISKAFWKGLAITTFNPFTIVWWIGIITPMIASNKNYILFSVVVLTGSLSWFVILAVLLRIGRKFLTQKIRRWIIGMSGLVVLGYSLYFFWKFLIEVF